ncbi:unnamed protein product [Tetraodon nigroviridis]|uniref:(spotted green pufferfish) hypothetical protein n=1 Tax=Tetraodon nigroviridis TaxID=99883 RepID=Q4RJT1_TETNG|nr:unnamed protein product [Tetraodon nigroviridis]
MTTQSHPQRDGGGSGGVMCPVRAVTVSSINESFFQPTKGALNASLT